jgi:hypothetical protein
MKDEALKLAKSWFEANTYGDEAVEVYKAIEQALAAQPAVPDAIHHTDLSEHPQYIEGWNDCRVAMMEMMK